MPGIQRTLTKVCPLVRVVQGRRASYRKENTVAWQPLTQKPAHRPQPPLAPVLTSPRSCSIGRGHKSARRAGGGGVSLPPHPQLPWVGNALSSGRCPPQQCWWLQGRRVSHEEKAVLSAVCQPSPRRWPWPDVQFTWGRFLKSRFAVQGRTKQVPITLHTFGCW